MRKLTKEQRDELYAQCHKPLRPGWEDVLILLADLDEADREFEADERDYLELRDTTDSVIKERDELRAKLAEVENAPECWPELWALREVERAARDLSCGEDHEDLEQALTALDALRKIQ